METYLGALEAGGTKFVCAVGTAEGGILRRARFPTTSPEETLARTAEFFREWPGTVGALGIASFGPVDLHRDSPTFGYITTTPKPGWAWTDVAGQLANDLGGIPVGFDTDVNGAALGEHRFGAGQGLPSLLYLTIGTGIGGGMVVDGRPLHGLVHPEMGHFILPQPPGQEFKGSCPYHGACFEGLASGPALAARWGLPAEDLPPEHLAWVIEAEVIATALQNFVCTLSPHRIVLGGGVMQQKQLLPLIRTRLQEPLNGYVQSPAILERIDEYIVPPQLGDRSGITGALVLAAEALAY